MCSTGWLRVLCWILVISQYTMDARNLVQIRQSHKSSLKVNQPRKVNTVVLDNTNALLKKIGMALQEKSSFRPVSNLTFLAKLVEKCMLSQFNTHCRLFNLLPSYQSAYREHHSCETSLIKLVNRSLWSMEHQRWIQSLLWICRLPLIL